MTKAVERLFRLYHEVEVDHDRKTFSIYLSPAIEIRPG